jgi:hypothetical protein
MSTITTPVNHGIVLGTVSSAGTYASPLTITASGGVTASGAYAVFGPNSQAWTVANYGTVLNTGSYAIELLLGGSITNSGTGLIEGYFYGVDINGAAGTVTNSGTIISTDTAGRAAGVYLEAGRVDNTGTIIGHYGVLIVHGGYIHNSGVIEANDRYGVVFSNGGTVINSGSIISLIGPPDAASVFLASGTLTNTSTGLIEGGKGVAIVSGTVNNAGTIIGSGGIGGGYGVRLQTGGYVDNSGTISATDYGVSMPYGTGTVINSGTIEASIAGIDLASGGGVTNAGSGFIEGYLNGVDIKGAAGTITNTGTILNTDKRSGRGVALYHGGSVTNSGTGLIQGVNAGVYITGGAGTVTNSGTIIATGFPGTISAGISFGDGTVVNSGLIDGKGPAVVYAIRGSGSVINSGLIQGANYLSAGSIDNVASGRIVAQVRAATVTNRGTIVEGTRLAITGAVSIYNSGVIAGVNASGVVTNLGVINGGITGPGLAMGGGTVFNMGVIGGVVINGSVGTLTNSGTIFGVSLAAGGTVIDSGTIIGSGGTALTFGGSGSDLLALEAGYHLSGSVQGSTTVGATNTLELSGTLGTVTATYNTLGLSNFQDVLFGAGGSEILKAANTTGTLGTVTLSGWTQTSEILDLTAVGTNATLANGGTVSSAYQLTASGSGGTVVLQLDATDATVFTAASDLGTGIDITPACFCRGTLILTAGGEAAVEDLAIGDKVVTLSGVLRAIKWIGRRAYDGRFVAANRAVLPIRVGAGALAPGLPARDLWLSPEHALYIDGALVPVGLLVNGATIRQAASVDRLEYFHIELERHDVILAEGAPAETFVDCDSRGIFHNAGEFAELYPDDFPVPWDFCAPRAEEGSAELAAIRAALSERAQALGYGPSSGSIDRPNSRWDCGVELAG